MKLSNCFLILLVIFDFAAETIISTFLTDFTAFSRARWSIRSIHTTATCFVLGGTVLLAILIALGFNLQSSYGRPSERKPTAGNTEDSDDDIDLSSEDECVLFDTDEEPDSSIIAKLFADDAVEHDNSEANHRNNDIAGEEDSCIRSRADS